MEQPEDETVKNLQQNLIQAKHQPRILIGHSWQLITKPIM